MTDQAQSRGGFTPGPWSHVDNSWDFSTVYDDNGSVIASVQIHHLTTEETQDHYEPIKDANARLIASAPDLLEALKAILDAETHTLHVGYDSSAGGGAYVYADAIRTDDDAFAKARSALSKALGQEGVGENG